jgi:hypothetical protein
MSDKSVLPISSNAGKRTTEQESPRLQEPKQIQQEPISDAELWRTATQTFDPVRVDSDSLFDAFGLMGSACFVLYSLQKELRWRGRKYAGNSPGFLASVFRLVEKRRKTDARLDHNVRVALAFSKRIQMRIGEPTALESPWSIPEGLSQRQRAALNAAFQSCARLFEGSTNAEDGKQLLALFNAIAAGKPGPRPSPLTEEIRKFYLAAPEGQKPTEGELANKFIPEYRSADGHQRRRIRGDVIRPAIRPISKKTKLVT